MFYRALVLAFLLFGLESWAVLDSMTRTVEGTHISFLRYIMGNRAHKNKDWMWESPVAGEVLRASVMKTSSTYTGRRQVKVLQWVDIRPIIEFFSWYQGFEGGRQRRKLLWRKEATGEVLRDTLAEALRGGRIIQRRRETGDVQVVVVPHGRKGLYMVNVL